MTTKRRQALAALLFVESAYLEASHCWLAIVQDVLQADWQDVWHLPQPPLAAVSFKLALFTV